MPIMAVADQNDARGNTRYMVRTAQKCIDGALEAKTHRLILNKIYRMLRAYRSHGFAGYQYQPHSHRGPEALTLMPSGDQRVTLVAIALQEALEEIYGAQSRDHDRDRVLETLDQVIFATANGNEIEENDRQNASRFFGSFAEHLQPSA